MVNTEGTALNKPIKSFFFVTMSWQACSNHFLALYAMRTIYFLLWRSALTKAFLLHPKYDSHLLMSKPHFKTFRVTYILFFHEELLKYICCLEATLCGSGTDMDAAVIENTAVILCFSFIFKKIKNKFTHIIQIIHLFIFISLGTYFFPKYIFSYA